MVGHNVGTFLQRARSGRGCSARASAADRAVAAQGGLASLSRLPGSSPYRRRRRSVPAARRRRRKAKVVRDDLFLRQPKVAENFNRTPWWVSVTGGLHAPLVAPSVAPALSTASLHARRFLRVHPGRSSLIFHVNAERCGALALMSLRTMALSGPSLGAGFGNALGAFGLKARAVTSCSDDNPSDQSSNGGRQERAQRRRERLQGSSRSDV